MIYLASTSPRRKALLKAAGMPFRVLRPCYTEDRRLTAPPARLVRLHAVKKAASCAGRVMQGTVLAADTVVCLNGTILGKPRTLPAARRMLGRLQGRWHVVYTGVALLTLRRGRVIRRQVFVERTRVRLKPLTTADITRYVQRVHPLDKAGAYAIQSRHGGIVQEVRGLLSNAIGLPVETLLNKLTPARQ